jgi:hypothetical protein
VKTTFHALHEAGVSEILVLQPSRVSGIANEYWEGKGFPGYVAVAIGNFSDPNFPAPTREG